MNDRHSANGGGHASFLRRPENGETQGTPGPVENKALLPALSDPYKAAGTADNTEVSRLVLVKGKEGFQAGETAYIAFQYVHLGGGEFGFTADGQWFSFVFADLQPKLVTVHGRNLLRMFDQISLRLIPWIRQADRDYRATGTESVITRIDAADWRRTPEQAANLAEALELHDA